MKTFYLKSAVIICLLSPLITFGQIKSSHHGLSQSTQHHHGMDKVPLIHWKFYGGIGTSTYYGRVTSRFVSDPSYEFITAIAVRPTLTLGAAYKFHDRFFLKAEVTNYWIEAQEGNKRYLEDHGSNPANPAKGSYAFRANNFDFSLMGQFNILPYTYLLGQGNRIVPYISAGIGFTTNTPQVQTSDGKWVNLNTLGNNFSTPIIGVLPFGLGVSYRISGNIELGVDVTARYTLAKANLDGLSKDGTPISTLNQKGADYFNSIYYHGYLSTNLKLNENNENVVNKNQSPIYNPVYTMVQIRLAYTIIPARFQHLFIQKDLNFSNKAKGQKTKRNFKR